MLHKLIAGSSVGNAILEWIEIGALAIEVLAVAVIVAAILAAMVRFLSQTVLRRKIGGTYEQLKHSLGRSLLLGLEILVAADVVRTVALQATLESVAVLGLLVLIRTFLSWALVVEVEGRWPWESRSEM